MTKRTAMLMAAGVVAALFAGSVALAFGLSGNTAAAADAEKSEPIVRTVHRTVRVEKDAKPADQPVQVVMLGSDTTSLDATSSDDAFEDAEEDSDDAYEAEYEDEDGSDDDADDHGSVDHEDEGHEDEDD